MRRSPQPNPRRGILRAVVAVLILTAILLAIILIVSSVTAPPAKAPIVPPTPGPVATPVPQRTATRPAHAATPVPATPGHKTLGLGPTSSVAVRGTILLTSGQKVFAQAMQGQRTGRKDEAASPDGLRLVYFQQTGDAYGHNPLFLAGAGALSGHQVGFGDPLVRPVWSPDGRYVLYVRVHPTAAFPGARWSLVMLDIRSRLSRVIARVNAMNLTPLGWSHGRVLFFVASTTDTSVYQASSGRVSFLTITMPQPLVTATLSPGGRFIAFGAPTNCGYCTVDVYDLDQLKVAIGPSGMPNEAAIAWTADGRLLVAQVGAFLAVVNPTDVSVISRFRLPAKMAGLWANPMVARFSGKSLDLIDTITHEIYRSTR